VHEGKYMCLGKLHRQVKLLTEYSSMKHEILLAYRFMHGFIN